MALHEQSLGKSDEWYTPPRVFDALGVTFDVDVAHPGRSVAPWVPALALISADSLQQPWRGFLWMNAPFGGRNGLEPWLQRFFEHGDGVALVPDRTSCPWWQDYAPRSDVVLAVRKKIKFIPGPGVVASSPAQGTTLFAVGARGVQALRNAAGGGLGSLWRPLSETA